VGGVDAKVGKYRQLHRPRPDGFGWEEFEPVGQFPPRIDRGQRLDKLPVLLRIPTAQLPVDKRGDSYPTLPCVAITLIPGPPPT
jgi:hypothetical protein